MNPREDEQELRPDLREVLRKDSVRRSRREPSPRTFWRSLGIIGMVGWPIALASVAGAVLGRSLDSRWQTAPRYTLIFLIIGVGIGCYVAWTTLSHKNGSPRQRP